MLGIKLAVAHMHAAELDQGGAVWLREDKLHFNAKGYAVWKSIVKPRIMTLAAMDGVTRLDAPTP